MTCPPCNHDCYEGTDCPRRVALQLHRIDPLELAKRQGFVSAGGATGWPPGMLQDDPSCTTTKGNSQPSLSKWLASKPDARLHAREAAAAIDREAATEQSDAAGRLLLILAGVLAALLVAASAFDLRFPT